MASISIRNLVKRYGAFTVIPDLNLEIADHEFVVFVGPSGCGKSTLLRIIAGLEPITSGDLYIGDHRVNGVPAAQRDIAMVFQDYALYPHMRVYDNMSFALELRGTPKAEIDARVKRAAALLHIELYLDRKPKELSGGQRQRVAMGRAIVRNPKAFLFDEPLSNLDAKLRTHMRAEIKQLHKRMQATSVYVTHDQVEAMTLADRIVIMNRGNIEQVGSPMEVFLEPANVFVASFIGSPPMNLFDATIDKQGGYAKAVLTGDAGQSLTIPDAFARNAVQGQPVKLGIRPEIMSVEVADGQDVLNCSIDLVEPLGRVLQHHVSHAGLRRSMRSATRARFPDRRSTASPGAQRPGGCQDGR